MKFTSFALLAVIMSSVVLAGCMGPKTTKVEVMVDTGAVVVEETAPAVEPTPTDEFMSGAAAAMSGAEEVVNQVVNEVTTAQ